MSKSQYLLLFRDTNWHRELSLNEIQEIMSRTNAWFEGLSQQGIMKAGQPLDGVGAEVSYQSGSVVDGPFTETKESVGGYILIEAASLEEAVAIARQNPMVPCGLKVEVRPVAEDCPASRLAKQKLFTVGA
ncbi:MAG: hypothetical protein EOP87_04365 [Verrucomicrobiaceae bacterium]|nr:MAG: hypothetical protein EOP87_04365 [Verrucomicrobiaceae bacterium]